jgi:hypothetical protein
MDPIPEPRETKLSPDGEGRAARGRASFLRNLRGLWQNFRTATFRSGAPTSDRTRMQKVFANFLLHIHSTRVHLHSLRFTTTLGLGIAALASFLIAAVTGILLMIYYTPSVELAYQSI